MGKRKFNAKGRQVNTMIIDNTETKQVKAIAEEEKKIISTNFRLTITFMHR